MTEEREQKSKDYTDIYDAWLKFSDTISKRITALMKEGTSEYNNLYEVWAEYSEKMNEHMAKFSPTDETAFKEMGETWRDYSGKIGKKFIELLSGAEDPHKDLYKLWNDYSQTMSEQFSQIMSKQIMEQKELYELWMDTFGMREKHPRGVSPNVIDALGHFWQELWSKWATQGSEEGTDPYENYKRLQEHWHETYSNLVVNLLRTREFASMNGAALDTNLEMVRMSQSFVKDYLTMIGLPTKEQMNEVFFKLYEIDKKQRDIFRSIKAISDELKNKG